MGERERALLEGIRSRAKRSAALRVAIGDDAAVLALRSGEQVVVTTDFSLEDVHFRRAWHPPEAVGHKCLARGLSDIAAMGARPVAAFLSLAVPKELTRAPKGKPIWPAGKGQPSWIDRFYAGLLALADSCQVPLAGGDLAESPGGAEARAAADIVVVGSIAPRRALLRSGARAGNLLYVTGSLGGAAAELRALTQFPDSFRNVTTFSTDHPHFFPQPRLAVGRALVARRLATAAIDISDGLSVDLEHLCQESGLRAEVDAAQLPLHATATIEDALHGGDDYELLFTAPAGTHMPRTLAGVPVHRIGRMLRRHTTQPQMVLLHDGLRGPLLSAGWEHF
jgi:thiamine-monophosphate kinase